MTHSTSSGLPVNDVTLIRGLARQVAELAALPVQQERIREWEALNGLRPERPMAMIDELPWHELETPGLPGAEELAVACSHPFAQGLETTLRRTLYRWNHMRVDMVVEPYVDVKKVLVRPGPELASGVVQAFSGRWGIRVLEESIDYSEIKSHRYVDQLATTEDLEKIHLVETDLDVERTAERDAWAHECLDGLLGVRMQGLTCDDGDEIAFALWDDIEMYRGTEPIMFDFLDRPEHLHAIADRLTSVRLAELDLLEAKGLLGFGNDRVHRTGAHTTELPKEGFRPQHVRAVDTWTVGRSQIFASVSDALFEEFVPGYITRWFERFGLGYFGCCDPLHNRIGAIRSIPNVRKISMSPWSKLGKGAEEIGPDYVFSRKPNPTLVAMDTWVPEMAEKDFRDVLEVTRANGCPVEFTLKDISTCRSDPPRLWDWCTVAERMTRNQR